MTAEEIKKHYENGFSSSPIDVSDEEVQTLIENQCSCNYCGNNITDMYDFPEIFDNEVMCEECYKDNHMSYCPLCENSYDTKDGDSGHVLITKELAKDQGIKHGIYEVLKRPFFFGDILGGFHGFFDNTLKLVANIDIDEYEPTVRSHYTKGDINSGFICPECISKHTTFETLLTKERVPCILMKKYENHYMFKDYSPERLHKTRQYMIHQRITARGLIQKSEVKDEN